MKQPKLRIAEPSDLQSLIDIDNESSTLFEQAGLHFELDDDHPFVQGEALRWSRAIDQGQVYVAMNSGGASIGFAACNLVDHQPYLDQLSVALDYMRQGIGTQLLMKVIEWSAEGPLWLTTYASIPWNQPFYERYGFVVVPEPSYGPELSEILRQQRLVLPAPEDRIAMVRYAD
ncbi:GNAT family N-acetyltransferase [Saccharospirillum sp. HFRX-1]|uniref:GNAT family N-acetyltransferase n=1 Tax=unclassified Saccharospirillum TaxID=2633430 RepID=UPI0037205159